MFRFRKKKLGTFDLLEIIDDKEECLLQVAPQRGACINRLLLGGQSLLDGYDTEIALDVHRWGKSALLFPFPNRLDRGRYQWQGQVYQFPVNDATTDNALHGIGLMATFDYNAPQLSQTSASISLRYEYDGQYEYYPFPFSLEVRYSVGSDTFQMDLEAHNTGDSAIPFGMGWHPYITLDTSVETVHLRTPPMELVGVDQRMIPTGKFYAHDQFQDGAVIGATAFDNCFRLQALAGADRHELELRGKRGSLQYWQETGPDKFNFLQLFTPPDRRSLAVEPMTCNVDAFNNGQGLSTLRPDQRIRSSCGFSYTLDVE